MTFEPDVESQIPELQPFQSLETHRSHQYGGLDTISVRESHQFRSEHEYDESTTTYIPEYDEEEPNAIVWVRNIFQNPLKKVIQYLSSLFPILHWIFHYNAKWAYGDLIAGITVGVVLVPQSMSYAQLAGLAPQYGLYSSFIGVFIYSFFATSKDVSIGPVAVMSMQVGKVILKVQGDVGDKYSPAEIATFLALICGGISAGMGILRLGFILEFISTPAVMGFMSGSALSIIVGQVPALMGYNSLVNTRGATYQVVIDTLKNLPHTKSDAAFGLVCLFILYTWKSLTEIAMKRWPRYKMWFFYAQNLRHAIVIVISTLISWGIVHPKLKKFDGHRDDFESPFSIIGTVPSGLRDVGVMTIPDGIVTDMASEIPVSTIILLLEHIAIAKSFGRVNDYKIIPDQELIAIGVNNLIGTFFKAYPSTGSFSRSALKAKCGVRTPLAGIFTGGVVLLALYCLTSAFYYISKATLSAIIIHAVSDLIANYKVTWSFWKINPLDCGIFLIAVLITVFSSIENGVYFAICASVAILLFRVAKPNGEFLGRIQVAEVVNPVVISAGTESEDDSSNGEVEICQVLSNSSSNAKKGPRSLPDEYANSVLTVRDLKNSNKNIQFHTKWVSLKNSNINNDLRVLPPPPGVIVFKPTETFTYPNCSVQIERVIDEMKNATRRGKPYNYTDTGSRPWNDPGPLRFKSRFRNPFKKHEVAEDKQEEDHRPILKLIHFDFSSVSSVDVTSVQALVDLRKAVNMYADREVEIHFSGILSPWIRRALLNAGFGFNEDGLISETTYVNIASAVNKDLEASPEEQLFAAVGTNTPFFHLDIPNYT